MKLNKSTIRLLVLAVFYVLYLVIGASVFSAIEGPEENKMVKRLRNFRTKFLHNINKRKGLTDDQLENFIAEIVHAANRGVYATRNVTMSEPNWSFGQSFFFASTVLTTIGYGRVTPLSEAGKAFCIIYAVIGIPLTLVMFSAIVERLMIPSKWFLLWMYRKLGHIYKIIHIQLLHLLLVFLCILVLFFLIPAGIYSALEPKWNYLDSFYYCFISLTTIGLGDYIPGDSPEQPYRALYKVGTTGYLFIGLLLMMLLMTVIYDIPELNLGFHFYMRSDVVEEERMALKSGGDPSGPKYMKHIDEPETPPPRPPTDVSQGNVENYQQ